METKTCQKCGKEFSNTGPSRVSASRWARRKLCSVECRESQMRTFTSESKECLHCGNEFLRQVGFSNKMWQERKYCTRACAGKAKSAKPRLAVECVCLICQSPFTIKPSEVGKSGRGSYCSNACSGVARSRRMSGEGHHKWSGGRTVTRQGYIRVWVAPDSPFAVMNDGSSNRVLEHRLVMAQSLGRPLRDDETVHHINGVRDDNRLENLQIRQGAHGQGAKFVCLDCGSHNVEAATI